MPRVTVTFSDVELRDLDKKCQMYTARMDELARQHTMTRLVSPKLSHHVRAITGVNQRRKNIAVTTKDRVI